MRLLIVEDEVELAEQLRVALQDAGYAVDLAGDGETALERGLNESYDAAILDLGLPGISGLEVLEGWRTKGQAMPVLVLTARSSWSDKVAGIDAGADDYVTKPFHLEEVQARLRALIRRASGHASSVLRCGSLVLNIRAAQLTQDDVEIKLTGHEFRVLAYLMHHQGRVIPRAELTEHIYDRDADRDSNTIEVFVGRLRRKIGAEYIQTVRGLGYRLAAPDTGR